MADYALMIGWDRPIAGREGHAVELFTTMQNYLVKQQSIGNLESFEGVLPAVHGGELNGFWLIRGEESKLHAMQMSAEFNDLLIKANVFVTRLGVVPCFLGKAMQDRMAQYIKAVPKT